MFSLHIKVLPEQFQGLFQNKSRVNSYQTRQEQHYRIPHFQEN